MTISTAIKTPVVAITGGASGIGRACAQHFARAGASIAIADQSEEQAHGLAKAINGQNADAIAVTLDVRSQEAQQRFVDTVLERYGRVDCVIAAAGISDARGADASYGEDWDPAASYLINSDVDTWRTLLDINLNGVMLTDKLFARAMIDHGIRGSIINIASIASKFPFPGSADYCVSKAGVAMLTKVLALELAEHGIRVNAIAPGFIETPLTNRLQKDANGRAMVMAMTPMKRFGKPEEIAKTAYFLASEEASLFTGEILYPTGGIFVG